MIISPSTVQRQLPGDARAASAPEEPSMRGFERLVALVAIIAAIALNAARPA